MNLGAEVTIQVGSEDTGDPHCLPGAAETPLTGLPIYSFHSHPFSLEAGGILSKLKSELSLLSLKSSSQSKIEVLTVAHKASPDPPDFSLFTPLHCSSDTLCWPQPQGLCTCCSDATRNVPPAPSLAISLSLSLLKWQLF